MQARTYRQEKTYLYFVPDRYQAVDYRDCSRFNVTPDVTGGCSTIAEARAGCQKEMLEAQGQSDLRFKVDEGYVYELDCNTGAVKLILTVRLPSFEFEARCDDKAAQAQAMQEKLES